MTIPPLVPGMGLLGAPIDNGTPLLPSMGIEQGAFPMLPQLWSQQYEQAPESILNPQGHYDPAVASALQSGEVGPAINSFIEQGVEPPAPGTHPSAVPGIGKALAGVTAPQTPTAQIPRIGPPAAPNPNSMPQQDLAQLVKQFSGDQQAALIPSLMSRVPHN